MALHRIEPELIERANAIAAATHGADLDALAGQLQRRGLDVEAVLRRLTAFAIAIPSWGVGTGGTRFARFPVPGEPGNVLDKLDDCAVVHQLGRATPTVSLHFPWDVVDDVSALRAHGAALGLGFDAVNSNTFQDQPAQPHSYKFGSLSHTSAAVRDQAIAHNIDCIRLGKSLGSRALTVWIADGSNFAGQANLSAAFERYIGSMHRIVAALPNDWQVFIEYKNFEPAFYATVVQDWGAALLAAQALGDKAACLVDLGHHAPSTNIEQIVSRLIAGRKLGGFHLNDSRYGDDDLDAGSIDPFRLFLIFNELIDAEQRGALHQPPAYMLDQSHNLTDPIESLLLSAEAASRAYTQALLVDRAALAGYQQENDALMAASTLRRAFHCDVSPLLAESRRRMGGAIDTVAVYRASGYRAAVSQVRKAPTPSGGGIV